MVNRTESKITGGQQIAGAAAHATKQYRFEIKGEIAVTAESEAEAEEQARFQATLEGGHDYFDLTLIEEVPACRSLQADLARIKERMAATSSKAEYFDLDMAKTTIEDELNGASP